MRDKTILITGATSGIGKATGMALAQKGAHIIFNTRNEEKALATRQEIQQKTGNSKVDFFYCDLSSLKQVNTFAEKIQQQYPKIDVLINNAGVFPSSRQSSQDGYEMGWAVNYLAGFLLTNKLLPQVQEASQGRIIMVSSIVQAIGKIDLEDLAQNNRSFGTFSSYATSKLAQIIMMKELAKRLENTSTTVNALHPGVIGSNIVRDLPWPLPKVAKFLFKGPKQGAKTAVYLASDPKGGKVSGHYFINNKVVRYNEIADDVDFRKAFWEGTKQQIEAAGVKLWKEGHF
jgi:NAD(P)-dependent dehydrogenase (short-subunit alcohol dehydrogenase family)